MTATETQVVAPKPEWPRKLTIVVTDNKLAYRRLHKGDCTLVRVGEACTPGTVVGVVRSGGSGEGVIELGVLRSEQGVLWVESDCRQKQWRHRISPAELIGPVVGGGHRPASCELSAQIGKYPRYCAPWDVA